MSALRNLIFAAFAVLTSSAHAESANLQRQREQFPAVWELAKHDPTQSWAKLASGLESYPLYPYLGLAAMQRHIDEVKRDEVDAFLKAWPDSLPAAILRDIFLIELAKRQDWKNFADLYNPATRSTELHCDALRARLALGDKLDFSGDIDPLWQLPSALPSACDEAIAWANGSGKLTSALIWQRIDLVATRASHAGAVAALAPLFAGAEREAAEHVALALRDPGKALAQAPKWPDAPHSRDAIAIALERLARRDADGATAQWTTLSPKFHFDAAQRGRVLRAIALYRASSYSSDAQARLAALPAEFANETTREWRVRAALAAQDFKSALAAIESMPEAQRNDARWRYLHARLDAQTGHKTEAEAQFRALASEPNYYGFLAADQISAPYAICTSELTDDAGATVALRKNPNLARAFEFFAINRLNEARREWDFAVDKFDPAAKRQAIALASHEGWIDRAVYAFNQGDDVHLYTLRFPLARREQILREAREAGIDPAWAYAIIRAESAWTTDAKSGANAYGLMQLLPGTAAQLARSEHLGYSGPADLFDPDTNIALGTRYLAKVAARFDGSTWLGSAAYNAGPDAVDKWVNARDTLDPDFFIETIPYKETREYVSRVLAFSVIYDWRLNGKAATASSRLPRIGQTYEPLSDKIERKAVVCPATVIAAATPATPNPLTATSVAPVPAAAPTSAPTPTHAPAAPKQ
jgi:soluble lytic murein transglycosylase